MKGSYLIIILLVFAGAMGVGLWYTIEKAYYINVTNVNEVNVAGTYRKVENYNGIDADTSPLKLRACFDVDWEYNSTTNYEKTVEVKVYDKGFCVSCYKEHNWSEMYVLTNEFLQTNDTINR